MTDLLGAYFSAAGDPSDPSAVWVTGQYAGGTTVGTTIAQLRFMPGVPPAFGGGVFVVAGDVDGVPGDEIITGPGAGSGPHVRIVKVDGAGQASVLGPGLFPYAVSFTGGVRVAACDFDGDLRAEIVTGAGPGGGPHVRVSKLDPAGKPTGDLASFFAYDPAFLGGVFVACGDIDGDGVSDLVTGADAGGGPHVRVFRLQIGAPGGVVPILEFFAFDPTFAGGIRVAAANVDGSDRATVVVGAGPGGGPHVRALKLVGGTLQEMASFFAYDLGFGGGVFVAAGQVLPGVGHAEIVTGAGAGGGPHVRVFAATGADAGVGFFAYSPAFTGGVHVTVLNVAALAPGEIVTAAGAGGGPHVRAFTGFGVPLSSISFFAY